MAVPLPPGSVPAPAPDPALTSPFVTPGQPPGPPVSSSGQPPSPPQPAPPLDPNITIQQKNVKTQPTKSATVLCGFVIAVKVLLYLPLSPFILAGTLGYWLGYGNSHGRGDATMRDFMEMTSSIWTSVQDLQRIREQAAASSQKSTPQPSPQPLPPAPSANSSSSSSVSSNSHPSPAPGVPETEEEKRRRLAGSGHSSSPAPPSPTPEPPIHLDEVL